MPVFVFLVMMERIPVKMSALLTLMVLLALLPIACARPFGEPISPVAVPTPTPTASWSNASTVVPTPTP